MTATSEKPNEQASGPALSEYKGNLLIVLNPQSKFPFQFGLTKAKLIVENIEAIKMFVESGGTRL